MTNVKQNVAVAVGLKAVFLVTTLIGVSGLWLAGDGAGDAQRAAAAGLETITKVS